MKRRTSAHYNDVTPYMFGPHEPPIRVALLALVCATCAPDGLARAQTWPPTPVVLAGGRMSVGGDVSATYGSDDLGFFNYTSYDTSTLRRVRAGLAVAFAPARRLTLLAEVRAETGAGLKAYGYYARFTPSAHRPVVIQAGKIPPVFGTFVRRGYPQDNPLIGEPLAYGYLTSLRYDALPATPADLFRMRGRGWLAAYPIGNRAAEPGLPVVAASEWDHGAQIRVGQRPVELAASWTMGSLSTPQLFSRPGRGQLAARIAVTPAASFTIGLSAATGTFLSDVAASAAGSAADRGTQRAVGLDAEFAAGHLLVRGELIVNRWLVPIDPSRSGTARLGVVAGYVEGRYRLRPGLYVATRLEGLAFGTLATPAVTQSWDADVRRGELAAGYSLSRNVMVKAAFQRNVRDGGRVRRNALGAVQAVVWF